MVCEHGTSLVNSVADRRRSSNLDLDELLPSCTCINPLCVVFQPNEPHAEGFARTVDLQHGSSGRAFWTIRLLLLLCGALGVTPPLGLLLSFPGGRLQPHDRDAGSARGFRDKHHITRRPGVDYQAKGLAEFATSLVGYRVSGMVDGRGSNHSTRRSSRHPPTGACQRSVGLPLGVRN